MELEKLEAVVLSMRPTDVLVLRATRLITPEIAERLKCSARQVLPEGVKVMVLDPSIELPVIVRQEGDGRPSRPDFPHLSHGTKKG